MPRFSVRFFLAATVPIAPLLSIGCASRAATELLETQLRQQEDALYRMETELDRRENELAVARREVDQLQARLDVGGREILRPEQRQLLAKAEGIKINRLLTGGLDRDGRSGTDTLAVNLLPHDGNGDLVKLPGVVEIELRDLSRNEGDQQIGFWEFDETESATLWHRGVVSGGYLFQLPWQKRPDSDNLVVTARLVSPDGREFETSEVLRIDPKTIALASDLVPVDELRDHGPAPAEPLTGAAEPSPFSEPSPFTANDPSPLSNRTAAKPDTAAAPIPPAPPATPFPTDSAPFADVGHLPTAPETEFVPAPAPMPKSAPIPSPTPPAPADDFDVPPPPSFGPADQLGEAPGEPVGNFDPMIVPGGTGPAPELTIRPNPAPTEPSGRETTAGLNYSGDFDAIVLPASNEVPEGEPFAEQHPTADEPNSPVAKDPNVGVDLGSGRVIPLPTAPANPPTADDGWEIKIQPR